MTKNTSLFFPSEVKYRINRPQPEFPCVESIKKRYEWLLEEETIDGAELAYIVTSFLIDKGVDISPQRQLVLSEACMKEIS